MTDAPKIIYTHTDEAPALAAQGKSEFDSVYCAGFEQRQAGDPEGALERFVAAYVLARELNYRSGEADALNMTGVCYKEKGDLEQANEHYNEKNAAGAWVKAVPPAGDPVEWIKVHRGQGKGSFLEKAPPSA